ncbi:hypothetical protein Gorai_010304 [Gossypium raimondii]|uniref:Uncharacterized protein n=1 Tax=Gossypium raimondii TaxID=29730 RepID=A0A7J8PVY3_GOSRA|nr:hypothetical protein [Gossypium raimondii]
MLVLLVQVHTPPHTTAQNTRVTLNLSTHQNMEAPQR